MSVQAFALGDPELTKPSFSDETFRISGRHNPKTIAGEPEEVLTRAVELGLYVLGESVAEVIFYNLEKEYSLKREDIPKRPDRFVEALRDLFGSGAATIEKLIVQSICDVTGLKLDAVNPPTLAFCMKQAEKALASRKKAEG